ncbi:mycofactocin biosynthesis chaperone MftB [Tsukamurella sp. 8F]|uniref:mycofactocin biosynthesis chaperone MftB n=1 Tax=unclassified Tsukamurella TaxID=2633480 RepID=UPI0023B8CE0B|nr:MULTISPECIES: mycofactocin biosynthesis chaperone MftB [unclassified Tsukamurella]MDF0529199.1 mycofactocin biosynthesis chaperone MftB [Tsukamurella sp. 8J]MDF0585384.1 mycofactocin biosynthesis chaperone MftB [Tsukamurella sp. 8F]
MTTPDTERKGTQMEDAMLDEPMLDEPMLDEPMLDEPMLDEHWTTSPSVALRPEPFGALLYHFGNRRLTFLKRPELVAVVRELAGARDVRAALDAAGIDEESRPAYLRALAGLADGDMIRRAATGGAA